MTAENATAYMQGLTDAQLDDCFRECLEHQERIDGKIVPLDEFHHVVAVHGLCIEEYKRRNEVCLAIGKMTLDEILDELEA